MAVTNRMKISIFEDLEDLVLCPLCVEPFNETKVPILLDCHHTFCACCMEKWIKRKRYKKMVCPNCRKETLLSNKESITWKTDFKTIQLADVLKKVDFGALRNISSPDTCHLCDLSSKVSFCEVCKIKVCKNCKDMCHKSESARRIVEILPPQMNTDPDMQSFMEALEDFVSCSLCEETYDNKHYPILLKCHHTFCVVCLKKWLAHHPRSEMTCPNCRKQTPIKGRKITDLTRDFKTIQIADFLQKIRYLEECPEMTEETLHDEDPEVEQSEEEEEEMIRDSCEICGSMSVKSFCETCDKVLCKKCGNRESKNNTGERRHYVVSLKQGTFCPTHKTKYLTHQCADCKEFICDDTDHNHTHRVFILEEAYKLRQKFEAYATMMKNEVISSTQCFLSFVQSDKESLKKFVHFHRKALKQMPFKFRNEQERIQKRFNDENHHFFSSLEGRICLLKRLIEIQQEMCDYATALSHESIEKIMSEETLPEFDAKVEVLKSHGDEMRVLLYKPLDVVELWVSHPGIRLQSEPYYFPYYKQLRFLNPPSIHELDKPKKRSFFSREYFSLMTQKKRDLAIITLIMFALFFFCTTGIWPKVLGTIAFFLYFACMMNSVHFNTCLW